MEHLTHEETAVRALGERARLQMAQYALAGWKFRLAWHGRPSQRWDAQQGFYRVSAHTLLGVLNALEIRRIDQRDGFARRAVTVLPDAPPT